MLTNQLILDIAYAAKRGAIYAITTKARIMKKTISNTYIVDGICKIQNRTELGFPSWSGILKWSEDLFVKHIIKTEKIERYDYERKIIEIENRFYLIFNDEDYEKAVLLLSSRNRWVSSDNEI